MSRLLKSHEKFIHYLKECATEFRKHGLSVDEEPQSMSVLTHLPGLQEFSFLGIPEPYNLKPFILDGKPLFEISPLLRAKIYEIFSYGDVGITLGSPGPSMSGLVVSALGSPRQKELYFSRFTNGPTWTFFGLSEPLHGSDPQNITTSLSEHEPGHYFLSGEKIFNGNGVLADIGVVFARSNPGPLGIDVLVFRPGEHREFYKERLPMYGARACSISLLKFNRCHVYGEDVLGTHMNPSKRFKAAAIDTFTALRPSVASLALGVSAAVIDYIKNGRNFLTMRERTLIEKLELRLASARALVHRAAAQVGKSESAESLSGLAKMQATQLCEEVTASSFSFFGRAAMLEHPWLNKWYRDARAFEYMEGMTHVQLFNSFQDFKRSKLGVF